MPEIKVQTRLIDLNKVDLAADARPHDPAALDILAHDMGEQGQLQEIIVTPSKYGGKGVKANGVTPLLPHSPTRYVVIAGVGRTLAARKLGWKEIRASVREGVSAFDRARITFAENEDREDADPFYQAKLMTKMLKTKGCEQQALAKELGLSAGLVSAYVSIDALPKKIGQQFKRLNLGQLIQIARLNNADSKMEFAENCAKNDLSVRQLKALVDRAVRKPAVTPKHRHPVTVLPDPLAKVWPGMLAKLTPDIYWEVHYGPHRMSDESKRNGWFFFASPVMEESTRADLARWFKAMGQALDPTTGKTRGSGDAVTRGKNDIAEPVKEMELAEHAVIDQFKPRIPKTTTEEAELAEIAAKKGPKAVYAWIYGEESPMAQVVPANTWKEMGMTAADGLRQVLDGIREVARR